VFVNSILVAIEVLGIHDCDLHLPSSQGLPLPRHYSRNLFRAFCRVLKACRERQGTLSWAFGAWASDECLGMSFATTSCLARPSSRTTPLPAHATLDSNINSLEQAHTHHVNLLIVVAMNHLPQAWGRVWVSRLDQTVPLLTHNSQETTSTAHTTPHTSRLLARTSTPRVRL
jgi:hypothetical protein